MLTIRFTSYNTLTGHIFCCVWVCEKRSYYKLTLGQINSKIRQGFTLYYAVNAHTHGGLYLIHFKSEAPHSRKTNPLNIIEIVRFVRRTISHTFTHRCDRVKEKRVKRARLFMWDDTTRPAIGTTNCGRTN